VERVPGPVDHDLEQLVPGPGRRREARDLVEEPELLELVRSAALADRRTIRSGRPAEGCDTTVPQPLRPPPATFAGSIAA
jgi:hypothetical protein